MRAVVLTTALGALLTLPALAQELSVPAAAQKPSEAAQKPAQQAQPRAEQRTAQQEDAAQHADPNYRWHSGHWWYWQNGGWLMWNGSRWLNQQERSRVYSSAPQRSFSYMQDARPATEGYVPTYAGIPQSDASGLRRSTVAPGTVEYQRVIPSYGMRSAGSKTLGNY
jgi:hypothetical protein